MFLWLLVASTVLYSACILAASFIIYRKRRTPPTPAAEPPFVTIVVAARNEETSLPACLKSLACQNYPDQRYEVIVANDHSTDNTDQVTQRFARLYPTIRYLDVPDGCGTLQGKAQALHEGIKASRGEIIVTTDADCTPPPNWLPDMVAYFSDGNTGMVCGMTLVKHSRLLDRIQALDWCFLLSIASATMEMGLPITAMGNNMAFRKKAYYDIGGYPALPFSVTEDYSLVKAICRHTKWTVRLPVDYSLVNYTSPLDSLHAVFRQRKRWVRGGLRAPAWVHGLYICGISTHLLILAGLVLVPVAGAVGFLAKTAADGILLWIATGVYEDRRLLRSLPAFEVYLFFYIILIPVLLVLFPRIQWKHRRF